MNYAYSEGVSDYLEGYLRMENPYDYGTECYYDWDEGWEDASMNY